MNRDLSTMGTPYKITDPNGNDVKTINIVTEDELYDFIDMPLFSNEYLEDAIEYASTIGDKLKNKYPCSWKIFWLNTDESKLTEVLKKCIYGDYDLIIISGDMLEDTKENLY